MVTDPIRKYLRKPNRRMNRDRIRELSSKGEAWLVRRKIPVCLLFFIGIVI